MAALAFTQSALRLPQHRDRLLQLLPRWQCGEAELAQA